MRVTHNFALYVNYEGQLRFLVCTAFHSAAVKDVQYEMCAICLKSFKLSSGNPHYVKHHQTTLAYATVLKPPCILGG